MHKQPQEKLLDDVGGEPLDGSGFEAETPAFDHEGDFGLAADEQEEEL